MSLLQTARPSREALIAAQAVESVIRTMSPLEVLIAAPPRNRNSEEKAMSPSAWYPLCFQNM